MQWLLSVLMMATGLAAAAVGCVSANHALRSARRSHQRIAALAGTTADGWGAWFLGGFSSVSLGFRWIRALLVWAAWTLAGIGLIGLGVHTVRHL